ncbi:F0F1 ATP synthase subunit gamma [Patescibacteria group bacterium]|nr:F0F1 ATP synthase subunit gamma [Patescibacteria group bacterium]
MNIREIEAALEEGNSLKAIAQAYSEIANIKIKKIRADVEQNRIFFQEISQIYTLIKQLAFQKKISIVKQKKMICMILTSNYRFYGSINSDLLEFFVNTVRKLNADHIYLGKAAIEYFRAAPLESGKIQLPFQDAVKEVLLKSDQPDTDELLMLTNLLKDYNQILIFYSNMKSLLVQVPTIMDLTSSSSPLADPSTHELTEKQENGKTGNELTKFIFEPELPKILQFFNSQVITLLLEGAFLESELSRTASRFISMDQAETEANKFIKQYQTNKAYAKRNMDNNTILENFAAMTATRKEIQ